MNEGLEENLPEGFIPFPQGFTLTLRRLHRRLRGVTSELAETQRCLRELYVQMKAMQRVLEEQGIAAPIFEASRINCIEGLLDKHELHRGLGLRLDETSVSKYDVQPHNPECERRQAICNAVCCSLPFPLSAMDIKESVVNWESTHPYIIAHNERGTCVHLDPERSDCTIYENRPRICRVYDCRRDRRIWEDYEAGVLGQWARTRMARLVSDGAKQEEGTSDPSDDALLS